MDQKTFLAGLSAETRAALSARSNRPTLWRLAVYLALIAAAGCGIALGVAAWPALLLLQAVLLAFLFNLQHECTHKTPFRTDWLNEAVGFAAGLLIVQPFLWFRYFHLAHHRHTNDPRRDPELAEGGKAKTWPQLLLVLSTLGYWRAKLRVLFANAVDAEPAPYVPVSARPKLVREARGMLALYALALGFSLTVSPVLLWVWLIPLALGLPLLRLYHLAEHGLCPQVDNLFLNTRTVLTNAPMRFLTWNMPYHAEHHILPTVPFYRLAALHRLTAPDLGVTAPGYRAFGRTYLRTLRRGSSVF